MKQTRKIKELIVLSRINGDGNGTEKVSEKEYKQMCENYFSAKEEFILNSLSISNETYIASGFNSFVVKLR